MKKVTLFLHENTHYTITCKKSYFFLSIHFSLQVTTISDFTLEVEGVLFFYWRLVYITNSKRVFSDKAFQSYSFG